MATTKTELLNNGVVVATKTAAPFYSWDWTPATSGASSLTYKRYEDGVLVFTSGAITGTVDAAATTETVIFEQFTRAQSLNTGELSVLSGNNSGWTSGAYSTKAINGVGEVTFTAPASGVSSGIIMGLTNSYSGITTTSNLNMNIALAILSDTYEYSIFVNGVQVLTDITYTGEVPKLRVRSDSKVEVVIGSTVVYTTAAALTLPLTPISLLLTTRTSSKLSNAAFDSANLITSPL